jgi:PPP family 3-phenylpropionic acid transporter
VKNIKHLWPFSFFFLIYAAVAAHGPYRVLYYQSLSFTGAQIGLLAGIAPLVTLVTLPLVTGLADRTRQHRQINTLSLLVVIAGVAAYPYIKSFTLLFLVTILISTFFSAVVAFANSASMAMLGDHKDRFSRIRLGGTLGFGLVAVLAGSLVENHGLKIGFWAGAAIFTLSLLVSQKLEYDDEAAGKAVSDNNTADEEASGEEAESGWHGIGALLKNPHFILFLLIGLSGGISFATLHTFLFPYMQSLGARESIMGLSLTIGTFAEIPILFFAGYFIKRYTPYRLILFSLVMTGLRFLLLAFLPTPGLILFIQLLNGFNYPLLTVAGVTYADDHAPRGFRATAQGLFNAAVSGVGTAIGGFTGGLLFDTLGPRRMYLVFAVFLAAVLAAAALVRRLLPPEKSAVRET